MQTKPGRVLRHAARSLRQACGQGRTAGMRKKPSTAVMVAEGFCLPERAAITGRSSRSTAATGTGNQNTADKGFAEPDGRKFVRNVAVNADMGKRGSGKHRRARIAQVSGGADPNWRSGAPMMTAETAGDAPAFPAGFARWDARRRNRQTAMTNCTASAKTTSGPPAVRKGVRHFRPALGGGQSIGHARVPHVLFFKSVRRAQSYASR